MSKDMGLDVSKIKATHPALSLPDEHGQPRVFRYRFIVLRQHLLCDTARQQTFSILEPNSDTAQPYTVEDFQFVSAPTVHRPTKTPLPPIPHIRLKDVNDPTSHDPRTALNPLLVVCNAFAKFEYYTSSHAQARTDSLPRHVTRTINLVRDILLQLNFDPEKRPLQPPFALTAPATPPRSSDPYATPRAEETPRPNTVWEDVIEGDAESGAGAAGAGKKGEGLRQAKKFFNSLSPSKSLSSWKHRTRHGSKKEESPRKSRKDDGDSGGGLGSQMGNLTIQFEARTGQSSYAALLKPLSALDDPRLKLAYADLCSPPVEDSDEDEESDDDEDDDLDDDSGDGAGENENNGSGWESESDEEREERSE
ncbi:hypothetical protein MNV49_006963 [Pseudohyphozyma bogoriensis]|nr:hypothetical protein MNV49_006963 [Pseudohyphozyma bogoriensis]